MSYFYRHSGQFTPECVLGPPGDYIPATGFLENLEKFIYSAQYADTFAMLTILMVLSIVGMFLVKCTRRLFFNTKTPLERVGAIMISASLCLWGISIAYWNIERKPFFYGETSHWKDEIAVPKPVSENVDMDWQLNRCGNLWELVNLQCMARQKKETAKCPDASHELLGNVQGILKLNPECNQKMGVKGLLEDDAYWDGREKCVVNEADRQDRYIWHESKKIVSSVNEFVSASFSGGRFGRPYSELNWVALTLIILGLMLHRGKVDQFLKWMKGG